jgi:hypothetical protein
VEERHKGFIETDGFRTKTSPLSREFDNAEVKGKIYKLVTPHVLYFSIHHFQYNIPNYGQNKCTFLCYMTACIWVKFIEVCGEIY